MSVRPARLLVASALALAALGAPVASATAHVPSARSVATITIKPATLDRGAGPAIPRVLGTTIVDGDLRIAIAAQEVQLFGMSGGDYVAGVWRRNGTARVERIATDGARLTIMDHIRGELSLSRDGQQIFQVFSRRAPVTVVNVRDAYTGDRLASRIFRGYVQVLDADAGRAVLGAARPTRTFWWNTGTDRARRISDREGYFADIPADRIGTFTGGPRKRFCSVVAPLSAPHQTLWRSCRQAVIASSPNGRRFLTVFIQGDGPFGKVSVHGGHGRLIVSYRSPGAFEGEAWETNHTVLLTTYGIKKSAIVRCQVDVCERATELIDGWGR